MPERSQDPPSRAEELFTRWLAQQGSDFEALCREHPEQALDLRKLHDDWQRVSELVRRAGVGFGAEQGHSFAQRLQEQYGSGVDPAVSLERPEPAPPSSQLLKRLAEHNLKGSRYQMKGEIARGGMGAILRVWDEDLRRSLAMKVIIGRDETPSGQTPLADKRLLARFLEEAQVTGQLDHPGIVPVHELGLDAEGRVYFTMKLVKGRDLKSIFDLVFEGKEGWNETRALGVILKVCEAMAYAHAKGVVHRDLKPANIMVGNFGEVYVMDWGLARVLGRADQHDLRLRDEPSPLTSIKTERREEREEAPDSPLFTMDGDIVGTPAYMSPEQAIGAVERLSSRSDVYALGAMLYHLLARLMPYVPADGRMTNRMVLAAVTQGPPTPLTTLRRDAPAELVAIVERAMARAPEGRYHDTLEFADDLRAYLEGRVVRAYEAGPWAEGRKWVKRNKALSSAIIAALVALLSGLVVSLRARQSEFLARMLAEEENLSAQMALAGQIVQRDSGSRWQLMQELGPTIDDRIVPLLAPGLRDPDIFVRMATARFLGNRKSGAALPYLLLGLRDDEASVREACRVALNSIAGCSIEFDSLGAEEKRKRQSEEVLVSYLNDTIQWGRSEGFPEAVRQELAKQARSISRQYKDNGDLFYATLSQYMSSLADMTHPADHPGVVGKRAKVEVAADSSSESEWRQWEEDLASKDSGTRWQAVQNLGNTHNLAVASLLVPLLEDGDIFVRMAACRQLGGLGHQLAIPALIDALEDSEASVREAALVALRAISQQPLAFDPMGSADDRSRQVATWREWWSKASNTRGVGTVDSGY